MKYYIISGEASGDLHAANLVRELRKLDAGADFRGWGGDLMAEQGVDIVKHYRELAFMGFTEVLMNLRTIMRNLSWCKEDILRFQPDVLILVDYPGFNLRIAEVKAEAHDNSQTHSQTDEGSNSSEELLEVLNQELIFVRTEMEILRSMEAENTSDHVERGAVVVTNQRTFFIGVSTEEIEIDGTKIFGMSEKAPLYNHMKGLRKGDHFQFNTTRYEIEEIY